MTDTMQPLHLSWYHFVCTHNFRVQSDPPRMLVRDDGLAVPGFYRFIRLFRVFRELITCGGVKRDGLKVSGAPAAF